MANINDIQIYCALHGLKFLDRDALAIELGEEVDNGWENVTAAGAGHAGGWDWIVVIRLRGTDVEVMKYASPEVNGDDLWCMVTDDELTEGFPLHVTK